MNNFQIGWICKENVWKRHREYQIAIQEHQGYPGVATTQDSKGGQKLAGSLAALRRFISILAERCLPFFGLLKGVKNKKEVNWSPEYQKAFGKKIKEYLSKPPVLTKAQPGEPLYMYLSAGTLAVGATLIREDAG